MFPLKLKEVEGYNIIFVKWKEEQGSSLPPTKSRRYYVCTREPHILYNGGKDYVKVIIFLKINFNVKINILVPWGLICVAIDNCRLKAAGKKMMLWHIVCDFHRFGYWKVSVILGTERR